MKVLVLLLLSLVQGRGCDDFMKNFLKTEHVGFRNVFPQNYEIAHHYNDSILCDSDPCCVLRAAFVLSDSWSQLLSFLWKENIKYTFIMHLQEKLFSIAEGKFLECPDPCVFPSVSSTPEALFNYTTALFSTWLNQKCPLTVELCEFSELANRITDETRKTIHAPFTTPGTVVVDGTNQKQWGGIRATPTSLTTSMHFQPLTFFAICIHFGLYWLL